MRVRNLFHILIIEDDGFYTPNQLHAMLKEAERQGHDLAPGSYLESMTAKQLDAVLHGKTDA